MPKIQHESWFYEKFMMAAQDFRLDSAADWACLRVYDGNALKPAMGQGFQGTPSSEQLENLYKLAEQGKLVFFDLTKETPKAVTLDGFARIEMNPVKPTEPVKPGENATNEEKSKYALQNMMYGKLKQNYEKAVEALEKLGEGFEAAMEAYNRTRDMKAEQIEDESRTANHTHVKQQRRLNNADRLIDGAFGPRPVAVGGYFHHGAENPKEFTFQYEKFDEQFAANGYDLPADSKLNAQEVATINFAMAGAGQFIENYYKKELKAGDAAAKNGAGSFQPFVTSCFSDPRIGMPYEEFGVLSEVFKLGKDMVAQYNGGNAGPLGAHLADCVRNLKATGTGVSWGVLSADMVAGARLIERIQELFDKHEDIKKAANLTEKELEFMRGYVQLGKAYDHYLTGIIKTNDAAARGEKLSTQAKTEILADVVLRNLISKDLAADKAKHDADPAFRQELDEASQKDAECEDQLAQWRRENPQKYRTTEEELYKLRINLGAYSPVVGAKDLDHGIIYTLAKDGVLEKIRSELMKNPAILEAAAKEPFEFSGKELENSEKLDALAAQAEATNNLWKTQVWYENMKTALVGSQPENWLNPNTPGDNNRLMIGWTSENAVTGDKEVKLIGLDALLEGGVKALENPSQETLNILYEQAAKGNLYYYDVGKDMPIRVGAENAWATAEQLKVPPQPTLWQTIAYYLTFGLAYADICNPTPDKDPAAFKAILAARESRNAAAQSETEKLADPLDIGEPDNDVKHSIEETVKDAVGLDASEKAKSMYGEEATLSESNVGTAADELRADINGSLNRLLNGEFDINEAKETFSKMVLLEVVKRGRSFDAITGDLMAGRVESTLAQKPEEMVLAMRENPYIKAAYENLTLDTLRQFVLNDGAKALANKITEVAKKYNPDVKDNALRKQNEQEMQKQQGSQQKMEKPEPEAPKIEAPAMGGGGMG